MDTLLFIGLLFLNFVFGTVAVSIVTCNALLFTKAGRYKLRWMYPVRFPGWIPGFEPKYIPRATTNAVGLVVGVNVVFWPLCAAAVFQYMEMTGHFPWPLIVGVVVIIIMPYVPMKKGKSESK